MTYADGQTIPESNIESYFVWIPRYRYRLWYTDTSNMTSGVDNTKPHTIDIVFENKNTAPSNGTANGEYLTHPAFTTFNVNGIWVGKFETGGGSGTSSDPNLIQIKPNISSWRGNTVYNYFTSIYNYKRNLDSHMMKNTEWGAVAYLSHSSYGIGQVYINNCNNWLTGCGGNTADSSYSSTCQNAYGSKSNNIYNQSTTGNISGVFDMSGGSREYMAAYRDGTMGQSGFTTTTIANYNRKYFDVYNALTDRTTYQYRILGDAIGEMGPFSSNDLGSWYADTSIFLLPESPWMLRGGAPGSGIDGGQFEFHPTTGGNSSDRSTRITLAF